MENKETEFYFWSAKGFTLIELLVVIVIIAILAALLFPVFVSAKDSAYTAQCISNKRQYGIAFQMYKIDHDDVNCPARSGPHYWSPDHGYQQWWISIDNSLVNGLPNGANRPAVRPERPGLLDPYLKSPQLKICPRQPKSWQTSYTLNGFTSNLASEYWAINPEAEGKEFGPHTKKFINVYRSTLDEGANGSEEEYPADTLIMWEHNDGGLHCPRLQARGNFAPLHIDDQKHISIGHRGNTQVIGLFADGHVRVKLPRALNRSMFSCRKDIYPELRN